MSLYNECANLVSKVHNSLEKCIDNNISASVLKPDGAEIATINAVHTTVPAVVSQSTSHYDTLDIYYISDLHLVHHLLDRYPEGATDEQIITFIHSIVLQLFSGEVGAAIKCFNSPVILFGGDVSSSFKVAQLFFSDFVKTRDCLREESYSHYSDVFASMEAELNTAISEIKAWKENHPWIKQATKPLSEYTDKKVPRRIKELFERKAQLREQIDQLLKDLGLSSFWREKYERAKNNKFIYAILGNHELWDFASYKECESAYKDLFEKLRIVFLSGAITWLGPHYIPVEYIQNPKTKQWGLEPINRDDNPREYEDQMIRNNNAIIVGDIGYAPLNKDFNANQGIYGIALTAEQEEEHWQKWIDILKDAKQYAAQYHCPLIVLTHMPVSDWNRDDLLLANCVFFNGHTHRNTAWADENNVFIYADGQIGYEGEKYQFGHTYLYRQRNPFAADPDGFREITCEEYKEYYSYVNETIPRTGVIEQQFRQYASKLYVIKQNNYYGFFMITPSHVCICNGGQLRAISKAEPIDRFNDTFLQMVNAYLRLLSPLRKTQEQISSVVKSIGGSGKIHGTIVDIDFENHIMVDTNNGSLVFYNSPFFGLVKTYPDFELLLHEHCPELEKRYLATDKSLIVIGSSLSASSSVGSYELIDIKNSPYAISKRINALQRLFDKHILRDWNDKVINRCREIEARQLNE